MVISDAVPTVVAGLLTNDNSKQQANDSKYYSFYAVCATTHRVLTQNTLNGYSGIFIQHVLRPQDRMGSSLPKQHPVVLKRKDVLHYRAILDGRAPLDVMVLGNDRCGKTSLITAFLQRMMPTSTSEPSGSSSTFTPSPLVTSHSILAPRCLFTNGPTEEANDSNVYETTTLYKGTKIQVRIHDCGSDRTRERHYHFPIAAFLLCYSLDDWASLSDLTEWLHETAFYNFHKTPYIVCSCKKDLRNLSEKKHIDLTIGTEEGLMWAREILAKGFFETSAHLQKIELQRIFTELFKVGLTEFEKRVTAWSEQKESSPMTIGVDTTKLAETVSGGFWGWMPGLSTVLTATPEDRPGDTDTKK